MAETELGTPAVKPCTSTPSRNVTSIPVVTPRPKLEAPTPLQSFKSGHLNLDTFSPVNQNGSFEFDRVLKRGMVKRRIRSKGAWKPGWKATYLVLRPNLLSLYKHDDETGIRASITLSDVTAVALVKKARMSNVFGVFSPSKNYHFQGSSAEDTADWIQQIRSEAPIDIDQEIVLTSPTVRDDRQEGFSHQDLTDASGEDEADRPSSPDVSNWPVRGQKGPRSRASTAQRQLSGVLEYSGNEMMTSYSDLSDAPVASRPRYSTVLSKQATNGTATAEPRPIGARNASQVSGFDIKLDPERVIRQGWLYFLKSKGGVKQWKKLWVVLRPKNISFYKNEQEYSVVKIVSMSSVINAAEIDAISRSKKYCLQVILEDKIYRFCAPSEDSLAKWLGSLKSVLARRHDPTRHAVEGTAALPE